VEKTAQVAIPIFDQALVVAIPDGMRVTTEQSDATHYRRELLPQDQNSAQWTRKMLILADQESARDPVMTIEFFADKLAGDTQKECNGEFSKKILSSGQINGYERHVTVLSCAGRKLSDRTVDDTSLMSIVKDDKAYYTLKWHERTAAAAPGSVMRPARWVDVYRKIGVLRPCQPATGETSPYASCLTP
jgi:hypothetical protein